MNISRLWVSLQVKWMRENYRFFHKLAKGGYLKEFSTKGKTER